MRELPKIFISIVIIKIPMFIMSKIREKPKKEEEEIQTALLDYDRKKIIETRNKSLGSMRIKFIIFLTLFLFLIIFTLYYTMIFCVVYSGSCPNWFSDGLIGTVLDLVILFIMILTLALSRILLRKYKNK